MSSSNEGIIVSGGWLNAGQVVVGRDSQAIQNTYNTVSDLQSSGKDNVATAIIELLKAIEVNSDGLQEQEEVIEAISKVAEEVKKEKPSKLTLKGLLNSVAEAVAPVAEILQKVVVLKAAIATLTGIPIP